MSARRVVGHMSYQHTPAKIGAGIGVVGALFLLLTTTLLLIVPQELLSSATRPAYMATWSPAIMTVGGVVFSAGLPLACAAIAYYLTTRAHTPGSVVIGFLVGGPVFVIGNAILGVAVTTFFVSGGGVERSLFGHIQYSIPHGLRLFFGGLLGIAGALVVDEYD